MLIRGRSANLKFLYDVLNIIVDIADLETEAAVRKCGFEDNLDSG